MINLVMIAIILICGFSIQKIKANRTKPNKFFISLPMSFAGVLVAILIVIFAFCFLLDDTFFFVIALLFAGLQLWAAFYKAKEKQNLKEYEEKFGKTKAKESDE